MNYKILPGFCRKSNLHKLDMVQHSALRIITGCMQSTPITQETRRVKLATKITLTQGFPSAHHTFRALSYVPQTTILDEIRLPHGPKITWIVEKSLFSHEVQAYYQTDLTCLVHPLSLRKLNTILHSLFGNFFRRSIKNMKAIGNFYGWLP